MAKSLLSATLSILGGKLGIMILTAIYTPLIIRFLGAESYGRYAVVMSVFALANVLLTSGTNDAIRKFISEREDRQWQSAVFSDVAKPALLLAVFIASGFALASVTGVVEYALGPEYTLLILLLSFVAIGRQCREFLMRTLLGLQLEEYSEPLRIFRKAMYTLLAVSAAYLGYDVAGILVADIISSIVITVLIAIVVSRYINIRSLYTPQPSQIPKKNLYLYIGNTIIYIGFLTSLYNVDVLFLQHWTDESTVGYYKGALVLANMLWIAPEVVRLSLLQRISGLWKDEDLTAIQQQASDTTRYVVLTTLLLCIGLAALAEDFVPLYLGTDFEPAVVPLLILIPGVVAYAAARPTLVINQGRRSLRPLIIATGACAVVNAALNALLVPRYEMIGAAVATSLGYGSLILFQTITARRLGYSPFHDFPTIEIVITSVVAAGIIFGVSWSIESSLISLVVVPPVGLVVFCVMAVFTGAVRKQETELLLSHIKSRV